ncbi:TPA: Lar family restriction alleviation protein [Vibrio parahaemolyticus]
MSNIVHLPFSVRLASTEWTIDYDLIPIKTCPFCQQAGFLEVDTDETYYVTCLNKACWVSPITKPFATKREAIIAWNHRG